MPYTEDLKWVLQRFSDAGYVTNKASNTYLIANILVDYANKIQAEKSNIVKDANLWDTNSLEIVTYLAYSRYRIYNPRPSDEIYESSEVKPNTVRIDDRTVMKAKEYKIRIIDSTKPQKLKIAYEDLLSGSTYPDYYESFTSDDGSHVAMDYVILPSIEDEDFGEAIWYPLSDNIEPGTLILHTRTEESVKGLEMISPSRDIDVDYLRFMISELFAKFSILNRLSIPSLAKFLKTKYQLNFITKDNLLILENATNSDFDEIKDLIENQVIPPTGKSWQIEMTQPIKIAIKDPQLLEYLRNKVPSIIPSEELNQVLDFWIIGYYREQYAHKMPDNLEKPKIPKFKSDYLTPKFVGKLND